MRLEFQRDKIQNVGMVNAQDAHIGPSPGAALLDDIGRQIEQAHERDGTGGKPIGRGNSVGVRPNMTERKSGSPAGLMNEGLILRGVEDRFQGITHR